MFQGFPHKYFVTASEVWIHFAVKLETLWNLRKLPKNPWSPFPHECAKSTSMGKDARYVGAVECSAECDGIMINFQIHEKRFNINEFTRLLALGDISPFVAKDKVPNVLYVDVLRARGLTGKLPPSSRVVIEIRGPKAKTRVIPKTRMPMYNESFRLLVDDPSSVLIIKIKDKDGLQGSVIGCWIMTLKWLVIPGANHPFCRHNKEKLEEADVENGVIKGWFPLLNRDMGKQGEMGEVQLRVQWKHEEGVLVPPPPVQSALAQMQENSAETALRLGNLPEVQAMLESFPLLLNCKRITFRNVNFYLIDLFLGSKGEAERKKIDGDLTKLSSIKLKMIDVTKPLHPRPGSDGLSVWGVCWQFWIHGMAPQVMGHIGKLSRTGGVQIMSGFLQQTFSFGSKDNDADGGKSPGIQQAFRRAEMLGAKLNRMVNKKAIKQKTVNAFDADFFLEASIKGMLEKSSVGFSVLRKHGPWNLYDMELKGSTLFYTQLSRCTRRTSINVTRKIDLHHSSEISTTRKNEIKITMNKSHNSTYLLRIPKLGPGRSEALEPARATSSASAPSVSSPLTQSPNAQQGQAAGGEAADVEGAKQYTIDEWLEFLQAGATAARWENMLSIKVTQVFGTSSTCQCKLRLMSLEGYDTANPIKVKGTPDGDTSELMPQEVALLGPWTEESETVQVEVYKLNPVRKSFGVATIPLADISETPMTVSKILGTGRKSTVGKVSFEIYKVSHSKGADEEDEEDEEEATIREEPGSPASPSVGVTGCAAAGPVQANPPPNTGPESPRDGAGTPLLNSNEWMASPRSSPAVDSGGGIHAGSLEIQVIKRPTELVVCIKKATNLLGIRKADKCNAFVKGGLRINKNNATEQKTKIVKKSLNPTFDTIMRFHGRPDDTDTLELVVVDDGGFGSKKKHVLGTCGVPIANAPSGFATHMLSRSDARLSPPGAASAPPSPFLGLQTPSSPQSMPPFTEDAEPPAGRALRMGSTRMKAFPDLSTPQTRGAPSSSPRKGVRRATSLKVDRFSSKPRLGGKTGSVKSVNSTFF